MISTVPPKIVNAQREFVLKAGQKLETVIDFEAYPKPSVEVTYNGSPITVPYKTDVTDDTCILEVPNVSRPDLCGEFNVKLTNPYGEDNVDITLVVNGKSRRLCGK